MHYVKPKTTSVAASLHLNHTNHEATLFPSRAIEGQSKAIENRGATPGQSRAIEGNRGESMHHEAAKALPLPIHTSPNHETAKAKPIPEGKAYA